MPRRSRTPVVRIGDLNTNHLRVPEWRQDASPPWGWLVLLTAVAAVLRTIGIDGGLWYDEVLTLLESVRSPFSEIATNFPSNNQHTLFSLLAHASIGVFGEHAWSLRLPAVLFGVATVPMLFVCARQCATSTEALLACLLMTVSYHHVWFSQNARGYSAAAFFTLVCSWLLLRGLRRRRAGRVARRLWRPLALERARKPGIDEIELIDRQIEPLAPAPGHDKIAETAGE